MHAPEPKSEAESPAPVRTVADLIRDLQRLPQDMEMRDENALRVHLVRLAEENARLQLRLDSVLPEHDRARALVNERGRAIVSLNARYFALRGLVMDATGRFDLLHAHDYQLADAVRELRASTPNPTEG